MTSFKSLFLSFFLVVAVGLALVNASEPRGPKITNKVRIALTLSITLVLAVRFS